MTAACWAAHASTGVTNIFRHNSNIFGHTIDIFAHLDHEGVHAAGAVLGAGQQLAGADHLDDLLVAVAVVGLQRGTALVSSIEDTELRDH